MQLENMVGEREIHKIHKYMDMQSDSNKKMEFFY